MSLIKAALLLPMVLPCAFGQPGPTLIGSTPNSYPYVSTPGQVFFAPGQIATLQVTGIKTVLQQPVTANQIPLPTVLAGISVTIYQQVESFATTLVVPLLSVAQTDMCATYPPTPDCITTYITVEIPVETMPFLIYQSWPESQLVISENGVNSQAFSIDPRAANTHVLTGCGPVGGACVTHADGSLVTAKSPAKPGETVVIYAYGLGQTNPPVTTGTATPTPAPEAANNVYVAFNFSPNAGPTYPYIDPRQGPVNTPAFAGLTPGEIGLYQINVKLPGTFPAVPACSNLSPFYSAVQSNLTIDITTYLNLDGTLSDAADPSYDAAPICVQPGPLQ